MGNYIVMCRVSGGVTGTREAVLKSNGVERSFETRDEAQQVANDLNNQKRDYFQTADFRYWVEEA